MKKLAAGLKHRPQYYKEFKNEIDYRFHTV